jgi:hypothetical protein
MFTCPQTGVALAALEKLALRAEIKKDDRVVVISTANGLKFAEFKVAYHTGALPGVVARYRNPPTELPDDYDAVRRAIDRAAPATERDVAARNTAQSRRRKLTARHSPMRRLFNGRGAGWARAGPLVVVASALAGVTDLLLGGAGGAPGRTRRAARMARRFCAGIAMWCGRCCRRSRAPAPAGAGRRVCAGARRAPPSASWAT